MEFARDSYHNRRRLDEPQIIIVRYDKKHLILAILTVLFGSIVVGFQHYYHNDYVDLAQQKCPAMGIYNFITTSKNLFLLSGFVDFAIGGLLSRLYAILGRKAEAICMGHLFMGLIGQVISIFINFFILANTIYGTKIVTKASQDPTVMTMEFDESRPEIFCHKTLFILAIIVVAYGYANCMVHLGFFVLSCYRICRPTPRIGGIQLRSIGGRKGQPRQFRPSKLPWGGCRGDPDVLPELPSGFSEIKMFDDFDMPDIDNWEEEVIEENEEGGTEEDDDDEGGDEGDDEEEESEKQEEEEEKEESDEEEEE